MTVPRRLAWMFAVGSLLTACRAPEAFYHSLSGVPQVNPLAVTAYAVGDTLTLSGKLGGPGAAVVVTIGGATAPIVAHWDSAGQLGDPGSPNGVSFNLTVDYVSVVIDSAMGLGADRPIVVSVNGLSASAGVIYISASTPFPARSDTLVYADTAALYGLDYAGAPGIGVRGDLGDGKVYWISGDTLKLTVVNNGAAKSVVMTGFTDQTGTFHNIGFSSAPNAFAARDPSGRYIYASLITDSVATDTVMVFRLFRIDLTTSTITTLNRTPFPTNSQDVTLASLSALTLTGPVGSVFLPPISQMFIGTDGTIYFVTEGAALVSGPPWYSTNESLGCQSNLNSAVGKIDPTGNVSYLVKSSCGLPVGYNGTGTVIDALPSLNKTVSWNWIDVIDPATGVAYASGSGTSASGQPVTLGDAKIAYNLTTGQVIGTLAVPNNFGTATNVSGPFASVNGYFWTMGVVSGGGHRVWMESSPTNTLPTIIEIADFDHQFISPYVAVADVEPPGDACCGLMTHGGLGTTYILNHTPNGDPIIAQTFNEGDWIVNYPTADAGSSAGAAAARRAVRRRTTTGRSATVVPRQPASVLHIH